MALTDAERDILRRAAEEILRRGINYEWFYGGAGAPWSPSPTPDCTVCALGAVRVAAGALGFGVDTVDTLREVLDDAEPSPFNSITDWNDELDADGNHIRTAEEVAELFLNVADNA